MKNLQKWQPRQAEKEGDGWGVIVDGTLTKPEWVIYPQRRIDDQDVALIVATHNAAVEKPVGTVECTSLVNTRLEPIVQLTIGPNVAQLHVREARQHVVQMQEAIEAALSDALLCRFIRDYIYHGTDDDTTKHAIGHLLVMFREFRISQDEPVVSETEA